MQGIAGRRRSGRPRVTRLPVFFNAWIVLASPGAPTYPVRVVGFERFRAGPALGVDHAGRSGQGGGDSEDEADA